MSGVFNTVVTVAIPRVTVETRVTATFRVELRYGVSAFTAVVLTGGRSETADVVVIVWGTMAKAEVMLPSFFVLHSTSLRLLSV